MNKREAALQFIRDNSVCLREFPFDWERSERTDNKTVVKKVEYRAVNGHAFVLLDIGKDGWDAFWPTTKNNVDVEMQEFEKISGQQFFYAQPDNHGNRE